MTNINRINPIWLKNCRLPKEASGNKAAEKSGKYMPKKEGPKTIPAMISPITEGCPIFLKSQPNSLATNMMTIICTNKIANGCCKLCNMELRNSSQLERLDPRSEEHTSELQSREN